MAPPRGKKRTWKQKQNFRKGKRRNRKKRVPLPLNGFPDKFICKHRYAETISCPATGSLNDVFSHSFNIASMYDPDATGGGHQPRGRDALAAQYDRYCVVGAKITCRPVGPAQLPNGTITGCQYGGVISKTSNLYETNGWYDMIEQYSYYTHKTIPFDIGMAKPVIRTYSLRKFLDHPAPLSDDVVTAGVNSNPSTGAFFILWCANPTGNARGGPIAFSVIIEQTVVWFRKKQQPMS